MKKPSNWFIPILRISLNSWRNKLSTRVSSGTIFASVMSGTAVWRSLSTKTRIIPLLRTFRRLLRPISTSFRHRQCLNGWKTHKTVWAALLSLNKSTIASWSICAMMSSLTIWLIREGQNCTRVSTRSVVSREVCSLVVKSRELPSLELWLSNPKFWFWTKQLLHWMKNHKRLCSRLLTGPWRVALQSLLPIVCQLSATARCSSWSRKV